MFLRHFSTTRRNLKSVKLKNTKGTSSHQWLSRQLSDPYVEKAKMLNYRCRSAFKLLEIDDRFRILSPGRVVVDCGAAPGSWTQVAVKRVNADRSLLNSPQGTVISIDLQPIYPIEGAIVLGNTDFMTDDAQKKLREVLGDKKPDVVISDMAPSATGVRDLDNEQIMHLCYMALRFAVQVSNVDSTLLVKLWQCGQFQTLQNDFGKYYKSVRPVKPASSRSDSAEIFLLGRQFRGLKQVPTS